jgi:C1A family cysteine protease
MTQRLGWIPDLPDHRDWTYAAIRPPGPLPDMMNLEAAMPPVYDQGDLGSCTANALAAAVEFLEHPAVMPSRLMLYYAERALEGDPGVDGGAALRTGIKVLASTGVCPETEWPYDIAKFTEKPPPGCWAHDAVVTRYYRLQQTAEDLTGCLAEGFPFVFGFAVPAAFKCAEMATTGWMDAAAWDTDPIGGHAVLACGYMPRATDPTQFEVLVRNSWGPDWGDHGYFFMPDSILLDSNRCRDFWTVRTVTSA